jgi:protein SCO1/2
LRRYGRAGASEGWHCLVGDAATIARLSDEVGYRSAYDPETQQYAHPSGLIILTPDGKISRYLFGVNFDPKELLVAILAAKQGESSSVVSKVFLLCFHYNPITGKYGPLTMSILRIVSIGFVGVVALSIFLMTRKSGAPRIQARHADG